jgi:hypothetical protein
MSSRTVLWRRLDLPGHEACRLATAGTEWRLSGGAVFLHEGQACRLGYEIACDARWRTLSAKVAGWVGDQDIDVEVLRDEAGLWRLNGEPVPGVEGCVDVDLNFSPSTNTLPIRRFELEVGRSAQVRAAWLRFPSFALEPLEQSYTRVGTNLYRYESAGGRFVASVEVDAAGLVTKYGEIWAGEEA